MNNLMGKSCPQVIKEFSTQIHDLVGNTTATSEGTVLKLSCYYGYRLTGYNIVKCHKGRWVPEVSACTKVNGILLQGQSRTTNPYLVPTNFPSTVAATASQGDDGNFSNYWGVSRDDLILILSICLALAFILLVTLIIALAYYHRKRRSFWDDQKRKVAMRRMMNGKRQTKALAPLDKRQPPWMPHPPVCILPVRPSIYMRPSGRPMYYPNYEYRWQHVPGRAQQLGYPFLMYHPNHHNTIALEENGQYTWKTNKSNQLRRNNGNKISEGDGRGSETESIEVVWDVEHMAWLDELEYTDSKIPRPSLNADKSGNTPFSQQPNGLRNSDEVPVISAQGQDNVMIDHLI